MAVPPVSCAVAHHVHPGGRGMVWAAISTVTTMAALVFALTREFVFTYWSRPSLSLRQTDEGSSLSQVFVLDNRKEVWQLALVANDGRRSAAEDVEVLVLD